MERFYAEEIIGRLPKSCWLMSVSEWALPIERGGIRSAVGEYALSAVGPGTAGARTLAIRQAGRSENRRQNTGERLWEMAVVPAVPCIGTSWRSTPRNLTSEATDGVMLSWSLGGYPSTNLELFQSFRPGQQQETCLRQLAENITANRPHRWYGMAPLFRSVKEFPYNGGNAL